MLLVVTKVVLLMTRIGLVLEVEVKVEEAEGDCDWSQDSLALDLPYSSLNLQIQHS